MPPAVLAHERYSTALCTTFAFWERHEEIGCPADRTRLLCGVSVCSPLEGACVCAVVGSIGLEGVCIKASLLRDTDEGSRGLYLYDFYLA